MTQNNVHSLITLIIYILHCIYVWVMTPFAQHYTDWLDNPPPPLDSGSATPQAGLSLSAPALWLCPACGGWLVAENVALQQRGSSSSRSGLFFWVGFQAWGPVGHVFVCTCIQASRAPPGRADPRITTHWYPRCLSELHWAVTKSEKIQPHHIQYTDNITFKVWKNTHTVAYRRILAHGHLCDQI